MSGDSDNCSLISIVVGGDGWTRKIEDSTLINIDRPCSYISIVVRGDYWTRKIEDSTLINTLDCPLVYNTIIPYRPAFEATLEAIRKRRRD